MWDVQPELSDVLVPNCVYRCDCPEMKSCGMWQVLVNWCRYENKGLGIEAIPIKWRYKIYNDWFYSVHRRDLDGKRDG